ncbi:unnamed protein product [Periconia digitata]|uniref:Uncharacterized protein n=1 Tax=Periconia digitata TaxID=1303443 RepID=A0A9W4UNI4_9PLEO|nr:unnamed protein product [Periconia digitata]
MRIPTPQKLHVALHHPYNPTFIVQILKLSNTLLTPKNKISPSCSPNPKIQVRRMGYLEIRLHLSPSSPLTSLSVL